MLNIWNPYMLIRNKFLRNFKKQSSFFLSIFFLMFRIMNFFLELKKKNERNFKIYEEEFDELYSVFFIKNLTNVWKGAEFSFFIKNEKEMNISISSGDNFGDEIDISKFYIDRYSKITLSKWKNFCGENRVNFLILKTRELFISFKFTGLFFNNFFQKKDQNQKIILFKHLRVNIFKINKKISTKLSNSNFRDNKHRLFFFDSIFEFSEEKLHKKGILTKKQTNWLKFDSNKQKIFLFNWRIKNFTKRILYFDKIYFSEKQFFFLYQNFSFYNKKSFLKWKIFLDWNDTTSQNIFDEFSYFSQFLLNFNKIEALSTFKKYSSYSSVFLNRLIYIENLELNIDLIDLKNKYYRWEKKIMFLYKKYKIFSHVSSNFVFFLFQNNMAIFKESSIYSEHIFSKKNCDIKSYENLNKKKKQKYMAFKKKNLFENTLKVLYSGQSENYFDFK